MSSALCRDLYPFPLVIPFKRLVRRLPMDRHCPSPSSGYRLGLPAVCLSVVSHQWRDLLARTAWIRRGLRTKRRGSQVAKPTAALCSTRSYGWLRTSLMTYVLCTYGMLMVNAILVPYDGVQAWPARFNAPFWSMRRYNCTCRSVPEVQGNRPPTNDGAVSVLVPANKAPR